jgi:hypothetical protein
MTTRKEALRSALDQEVRRGNARRRWRLPLLAVGACTLAGALTAGAIVGGGLLQFTLTHQEAQDIVDSGSAGPVRFISAPVVRVTDATTTLTLPSRPSGDAHLAFAAQCGGTRTVTVTIDTNTTRTMTCGDPATTLAVDGRPRSITFTPSERGGLTVWAGWVRPDPIPKASAAQREATADGVVTRSEYLAAWNRYLGCMTAQGHSIDGSGQTTNLVASGIPSAAYEADAHCYPAEFGDVDGLWQGEHAQDHTSTDEVWGGLRYDPSTDDPRFAQ